VPLEIIEVQNGEYVGEDDIVRLDDQYGRAKTKAKTEKKTAKPRKANIKKKR
jgi:mannose-1-phosphate guanylyltransferase/mannose-6-phosphate isomerase